MAAEFISGPCGICCGAARHRDGSWCDACGKTGTAHIMVTDAAFSVLMASVERAYEAGSRNGTFAPDNEARATLRAMGEAMTERKTTVADSAPRLSGHEALEALNQLRSNIVATQSASWSNVAYPLVAILDAAGFEQGEATDEQRQEHHDTYGGAGGWPGNRVRTDA